jgi:hypothetical protein
MQSGYLHNTNRKHSLLSAVYDGNSSLSSMGNTTPSRVAVENCKEEVKVTAVSARLHLNIS